MVVDIKPKIVIDRIEIVAVGAIVGVFIYTLPSLLSLYDRIDMAPLLLIVALLHAVVLWVCLRLIRLYESRTGLIALHTAALDLHATMTKLNEQSALTIKAQEQLLRTIREAKKIGP